MAGIQTQAILIPIPEDKACSSAHTPCSLEASKSDILEDRQPQQALLPTPTPPTPPKDFPASQK